MTTPIMFRAGGVPSGVPAFSGPATFICDVSEFQPSIADAVYLAWSKAIIIRAMYGDQHDDAAWYGGARRDALHADGAQFVGIYQYIVASQDAAAQAHALVNLLGPLRPGEIILGDLEEGTGDQQARWQAWQQVILAAYPQLRHFPDPGPWQYSGLDFAATHGLHPQWVAAYQAAEPAMPHLLWQFSSSYPVPGVGLADCSIYHGSVAQLRARITPVPKPTPLEDPDMIMIQPIQADVPKSTPWPGVFMLYSNGTMRHITGSQGDASNVAAYTAAGIKGPVQVSWEEWQGLLQPAVQ